LGIQIAQQRPKLAHAIGDGLRQVAVGLAARQRLLVTLAGGLLPILQTVPVQFVERPHNAAAHGLEIFQRQTAGTLLLRFWIRARQGPQYVRAKGLGNYLACIHAQVHHRHSLALGVIAPYGDYNFTEILLVLNPIQLDLQARELVFLNVPFLQE
jgi:hypothetical protein